MTFENDTVVADQESTAQELTTAQEVAAQELAARPAGSGVARWLVPVLMAAMVLASAGFAAWVYVKQYRPDQQTDATVFATVTKAASDGAAAMLSYAPETMDRDFASAKSHLTGDFLNYYTKYTNDVVARAVKERSVKTQATVVRAAVSELQPDTAQVLAFINQTTVSKENPDGAFAQSAVKITMTKVDGNWLISAFDPV